MGGRKLMWVMMTGLIGHAGAAWAGGAVCAVTGGSPRASIVSSGVVGRDRANPAVNVRRDKSGRLVVELKGKDALIRREFFAGNSTTILSAGGRQLTIQLTSKELIVTESGKTIKANVQQKDSLEQPFMYLRQSPVVTMTRALLEQADLNADSVEGNALLLTRALLGSAAGDSKPTVQYQTWATARTRSTRVVRAAQSHGPGDCWDMYAAEAVRIANDYLDCANSCNWSGWWCLGSCGFLYDIRAEAAFMWFMNCSGGFFVAG